MNMIYVWEGESEVFGHWVTVQIDSGQKDTFSGYEKLDCVRMYIDHYFDAIGRREWEIWDGDEMGIIARWDPDKYELVEPGSWVDIPDPKHGKIVDWTEEDAYHRECPVYEDGWIDYSWGYMGD